MTAEQFRARLEGVRRSGNEAVARCPAHDDGTASLCVSEGDDGRVLIYCQAKCPTENVVAALGLAMKDLMPEKTKAKSRKRARVVATYEYRDVDGTLLFEVQRKEDKSFPQRRPNPAGGWVLHLDCSKERDCRKLGHEPLTPAKVPRVPYRLPELRASSPPATAKARGSGEANSPYI
jgi:ribosomal protein L24E